MRIVTYHYFFPLYFISSISLPAFWFTPSDCCLDSSLTGNSLLKTSRDGQAHRGQLPNIPDPGGGTNGSLLWAIMYKVSWGRGQREEQDVPIPFQSMENASKSLLPFSSAGSASSSICNPQFNRFPASIFLLRQLVFMLTKSFSFHIMFPSKNNLLLNDTLEILHQYKECLLSGG